MDLNILADMLKAVIDLKEYELDVTMQVLAWQTAQLMNSTGNYKTAVKPDKLYKPMDKFKKQPAKVQKQENIEAKRKELLDLFGLANGGSTEGG